MFPVGEATMKKIVGEHYKKGITTVEGHMVIKTSVKKL